VRIGWVRGFRSGCIYADGCKGANGSHNNHTLAIINKVREIGQKKCTFAAKKYPNVCKVGKNCVSLH